MNVPHDLQVRARGTNGWDSDESDKSGEHSELTMQIELRILDFRRCLIDHSEKHFSVITYEGEVLNV